MSNLTIIDGHSYIYGAFYGVLDKASTKNKIRMDAVYGFFALLRVIIKKFPKNKLFIVFDSKKWFQEKLQEKKSQELKELRSLIDQQMIVQKLLNKVNIKWVQYSKIKADNIIASLAKSWAKKGDKVQISSGDYDFVQLISKDISLARNLHGLITLHDVKFIKQKFGIKPEQYVDFQAMVGDENDSFSGIPGIGPKTAAKLLNEYKNIAGIYKSINKIPASIAEKLKSHKSLVLKNQKNIPMTDNIALKEFIKGKLPDVDQKKVSQNINSLLSSIGIE
ncbi:MAG TPA: 5'-3' exonuclease H3TH domain-containing protein [Alphaproteobacteria bacterium]|nr:5'-3' exonuclease H3TH domain-containing protein [Alphaproteobacteria bacterium]